jgi:hypothetical protein
MQKIFATERRLPQIVKNALRSRKGVTKSPVEYIILVISPRNEDACTTECFPAVDGIAVTIRFLQFQIGFRILVRILFHGHRRSHGRTNRIRFLKSKTQTSTSFNR